MIDGILVGIVVLFIYSFWWFDFCFLNRNISKFKKVFEKAEEKSDIIIIVNTGGWGTIDYKKAFDLNPFLYFIEDYLKQKGLRVSIVQYFRTEDHLIGRIGYIKDYLFLFEKQGRHIFSMIKNTNKKILFLGLSNGALIADEIMEKAKDISNIFSIELGKPFFGVKSDNKNILLIENYEDELSNGNVLELFKTAFIYSWIRWIKNFIIGEGVSLNASFEIKGHNYPFQKYKDQVVEFIDEKVI